jgi:hypothetical protein
LPVVQPDGRLAGLLTAADVGETFRLLSARPQLALGNLVGRRQTAEPAPLAPAS